MKLLFIRHGDPDYENDTLTEKGWREAKALVPFLKDIDVARFYCSPLGRARDTISLTLAERGETAEICDFLQEFPEPLQDPRTGKPRIAWDLYPSDWTASPEAYDTSRWEQSQLYKVSPEVKHYFDQVGESLDQLIARHGYHRDGGLYRTEQGNHDTIVLVCHMGITLALLSHLLNVAPPLLWHGAFVAPTSMTLVETEEREKGVCYFRLRFLGATPHLTAVGEPVSGSGMYREVFEDEPERIDMFTSPWKEQ